MARADLGEGSPSAPPHGTPSRNADRLGIAATIAAAIFVLSLSWFKLASVDIGYHVAYGGEFLDHGTIVDRDPFLLPSVAEPFINANWGSQVIMALAYRAAGAGGLIALRVFLIALTFGLMGWIVRRATGRWQPVAWTWLIAGLAAYERFTMRPELLSYAIMLAMLAVLHGRTITRRGVIALIVLQLLWVNTHSYFLIGLMLTGAYAFFNLIRFCFKAHRPQAAVLRQQGGLLNTALTLQIAVCFLNPWFHEGAMFPIAALRELDKRGVLASGPEQSVGDSPWAAISEFHSPWSHVGLRVSSRTLSGYLVMLVLAAVAAVAAIHRFRWAELLILIILVAMSLQMRRNIAQFALAGAPIAMCLLAGSASSGGRRVSGIRKAASMMGCGAVIVLAGVWCAGIVSGRFYYTERRLNREFGAGWSDYSFVNDAASWLSRQADATGVFEPGAGLFVNYNASSNVLPALGKRFKLLVDTNTFAYKEETLSLAQRLGQGTPRYAEDLERLGIRVVLIQCGADADELVRQLLADFTEWALIYFDRQAVIFVRRISAHVPLIAANRLDASRLDPQAWISKASGSQLHRALELGASASVPLALDWPDKAIPMFQEAVRLAPDYDEAWVNLGKCFGMRANRARDEGRTADQAAADLKEAIRCLEIGLSINAKSVEAVTNLKKVHISLESLYRRPAKP